MSKFATFSKDLKTTTIIIQGARKADSNNAVAGIVFQNYDDDTNVIYDMAKINVVDHYGNSTQNGLGDLVFETNNAQRLRINFDGQVVAGVPGTSSNVRTLNVNGGIALSGPLTFLTSNGQVAGTFYPNGSNELSYSSNETQALSSINVNVPFTMHKFTSKDAGWRVMATASNVRSNVYFESYLHTNDVVSTYDMRLYNPITNSVLYHQSNMTNSITQNYTIPNTSVISRAEIQAKANLVMSNYGMYATVHVNQASHHFVGLAP